jgi:uncharacterized RDD family membrane protein YckC
MDRRADGPPRLDEAFGELGPGGLVAAAAAAVPPSELLGAAGAREPAAAPPAAPARRPVAAARTAPAAADAAPPRAAPAPEPSRWELGAPALRPPPPPPERAAPGSDGVPEVEVEALEIHLTRAPTWRRVVAGLLDGAPFAAAGALLARALVGAASAGLPAPATGLDGLLDLVARERVIVLSVAAAVALALGVYATLTHALAGATVGKWACGLRVVGPDGARPGLLRSAVRTALAGLSVGLLGLGLVLALFTRSGRALHDLLARTWVVRAP